MIQGAIFDMDGLMFDTEQVWQRCWSEIAAEMNLELDPQFRKDVCGSSGELMWNIVAKYYGVENGRAISEDCRSRVFGYLAIDVPEKPE